MEPPPAALNPANTAIAMIHASRISTLSQTSSMTIAPKDRPVPTIATCQALILPIRRDKASHAGTPKVEGTM